MSDWLKRSKALLRPLDSLAVEERHVDAPVVVAGAEADVVGAVNQIGVEDHRAVLAIGHAVGLGPGLVDEALQCLLIDVLNFEAPIERSFFIPNDQAARIGIEVGVFRREPEVDVDGGRSRRGSEYR